MLVNISQGKQLLLIALLNVVVTSEYQAKKVPPRRYSSMDNIVPYQMELVDISFSFTRSV